MNLLARATLLTALTLTVACRSNVPDLTTLPRERTVETATLRMHILEQGSGPLVLMLHGFPELGYSWRQQLDAFAGAGFHAVAPDMRGYGGSEAPLEVEAYDSLELAGDVLALMDALGEERAVLVGHDWGAVVAWYAVLMHPERFDALIAMSVPFGGRGRQSYLTSLRQQHGDNFHYMLHFQEPGVAEAELDPDPRALFERFYTSPGQTREPATITSPLASAGGLLGRFGRATELPDWLTEEDMRVYVEAFERTGFRGGLNYYRNFDRTFERSAHLAGATIEVPVLFLAGEEDLVIAGAGRQQLEAMMAPIAPRLEVRLYPNTGHWVQQERAAQVNAAMLEFVDAVLADPDGERAR